MHTVTHTHSLSLALSPLSLAVFLCPSLSLSRILVVSLFLPPALVLSLPGLPSPSSLISFLSHTHTHTQTYTFSALEGLKWSVLCETKLIDCC